MTKLLSKRVVVICFLSALSFTACVHCLNCVGKLDGLKVSLCMTVIVNSCRFMIIINLCYIYHMMHCSREYSAFTVFNLQSHVKSYLETLLLRSLKCLHCLYMVKRSRGKESQVSKL